MIVTDVLQLEMMGTDFFELPCLDALCFFLVFHVVPFFGSFRWFCYMFLSVFSMFFEFVVSSLQFAMLLLCCCFPDFTCFFNFILVALHLATLVYHFEILRSLAVNVNHVAFISLYLVHISLYFVQVLCRVNAFI